MEINNKAQTIDTHMSNNERKEGGIIFKGKTEAIYKVIVIGDPISYTKVNELNINKTYFNYNIKTIRKLEK